MRSAWLRAAFVAASVAWAALLPLVPFLASRAHASAFGTALVVVVYSVGGLICHQLPERSFHLWTAQMPVCARCAGIYFGAAIAAIMAAVRPGAAAAAARATGPAPLKRCPTPCPPNPQDAGPHPSYVRHRFSGAARARLTLVAATLPTILTLAYEWTTGHTPSNLVRAASGIPLGAAVAWLLVQATRDGATARNQVN